MNFKKGFSLIEILVVLGVVTILMGITLSRVDTSKDRARNNSQIARVQQLGLALQDYMASCRSYPDTLTRGADNTRGSGVCAVTFGDVVGGHEESLVDFMYMPLQSVSGYCDGFHLSIQLTSDHPRLETDDDFDFVNQGVWSSCNGASPVGHGDDDLFFDIKRP